MTHTPHRLATLALGAWLAAAAAALAQDLSRADADAMAAKIDRVIAVAELERSPSAAPVITSFSEPEIHAYVEFYGHEFLPPGVAKPRVSLGANGRVAARAVVDLDAVRLAHERGFLDPLAFMTGSLEVVATGAIATAEGQGIVRFESATVGGIAVPRTVAQELLRFYTQTPERPGGFAFDEPFELPPGVRDIEVDTGRATLTQ